VAGAFVDRLSRAVIFAFALCEFAIAAFAIASKVFFYDFLFGRMVALSDDRWLVFLITFQHRFLRGNGMRGIIRSLVHHATACRCTPRDGDRPRLTSSLQYYYSAVVDKCAEWATGRVLNTRR
jgi:hypothetical protein